MALRMKADGYLMVSASACHDSFSFYDALLYFLIILMRGVITVRRMGPAPQYRAFRRR